MRRISTWMLAAALLGWGNAWAVTCANQNINIPANTEDVFKVIGSDATVIDSRTGLEWKRCREGWKWSGSTCQATGDPDAFRWEEALEVARDSTFFDGGGWRLPNMKELKTLVERRCWSPSIDTKVFPHTGSINYWSSTYHPSKSTVWLVDFDQGASRYGSNHLPAVRLVRGGQPLDSFDLLDRTPTTTTIDSDSPDPSVAGQTVAVGFSVTGGSPAGEVTVTASTTESCSSDLSGGSGSCNLVFNTTGLRDLTAEYAGDIDHLGSTSAAEPHQVNPVPDPTADFTADPYSAACNQSVSFDGSASSVGHVIRTLVSWEWDFDNDGQYDDASGEIVSHAFGTFGSYPVGLLVTDDGGASHSDTQTIEVDQGNTPPAADAGGPYSIEHGDSVTLDGLGSSDPDASCGDNVMAGAWEVDNDGQYDDATGETPTIPWSPQLAALGSGTHTIGLRVVDGFGAASTAATTLTINPLADLAVTKTDGVTSAVPGQGLTYTIVAGNNGPSAVAGVSLADTFAAVLTCNWTSTTAGGAAGNTAAGFGNLSETLDLPSGSSVTYTVNCTIAADATGTLSNTATITSTVNDPTPGNNSVTDNDTVLVGFAVTESAGSTQVNEGGASDSFTVVLSAQPQNPVVITIESADTGEATVNPASLTFDNADWDQPRTVTVMGVDDLAVDGDQTTTVTVSVDDINSDDAFDPLDNQTVTVAVIDGNVQTYTAPTATGTGDATLTISGGSCALDLANTAFIATDGLVLPPSAAFPHGAVEFRVTGCAIGASIDVTLTFPEVLNGATGWKLDAVENPLLIPDAVIDGNTVSYTAVDGGVLDEDGAPDGNFSDPFGPAIIGAFATVPTLGEWGRWLLPLSLLLLGWRALGARRRL